jgi:hypothetical protein
MGTGSKSIEEAVGTGTDTYLPWLTTANQRTDRELLQAKAVQRAYRDACADLSQHHACSLTDRSIDSQSTTYYGSRHGSILWMQHCGPTVHHACHPNVHSALSMNARITHSQTQTHQWADAKPMTSVSVCLLTDPILLMLKSAETNVESVRS